MLECLCIEGTQETVKISLMHRGEKLTAPGGSSLWLFVIGFMYCPLE
jgi:hypothetical protein